MSGRAMEGRVCLVTGATSGHGLAVARALARLGAELVVHGRSAEKCKAVQAQIAAETGREPGILLADMASRADIDRAADEVLATGRPLHVLVNNAGVVSREREETVDGVEVTFAVNYLATFQLTLRLLERLRESAPARIVIVSSDTHRIASLDLDDLGLRRGYNFMKAYGRSKLALVHFTRQLALRLRGSGVTVNAVDPGPVQSNIGQNNPGLTADLLKVVMRRFFKPADEACDTAVYLATSPEVEGVSGGYFRFMERKDPSVGRGVPDLAPRLWDLSLRMTGVREPGVAGSESETSRPRA